MEVFGSLFDLNPESLDLPIRPAFSLSSNLSRLTTPVPARAPIDAPFLRDLAFDWSGQITWSGVRISSLSALRERKAIKPGTRGES